MQLLNEQKTEIKSHLEKIGDKTTLILSLSVIFGVEPNTIRNNWFGPLLSVPKKHREQLLEYLKDPQKLSQ